MLRFFLTFIVLQLTLFGINMLGVVQQHILGILAQLRQVLP